MLLAIKIMVGLMALGYGFLMIGFLGLLLNLKMRL